MSGRIARKGIPDELEFVPNKGTYAARKIVLLNHNIVMELCFHKHYYERLFEGDAKGKRVGRSCHSRIFRGQIVGAFDHV